VPETPDTDVTTPQVDTLLDAVVEELGGERRAGQHEMARAAAEAFSSGGHLLVQAGTGTGKSIAYLVPAVRHSVLSGQRVIVSTATLALQRQILTRDLPLVCGVIASSLPRPPTTALLKGWHNYLCVHKIAGGYPVEEQGSLLDLDPGDERVGAAQHPARGSATETVRASAASELGREVQRLRAWAESTDTGDRDDCVPGVPDRAWRQVSVTALECVGRRCPMIDDCFPERARAAAHEADLVVTNHAMLGIAASGSPGVLPEHSALVVDEAHELSDRVTAQATWELSVASVEHAARSAKRHGGVDSAVLDAASAALGSALADVPDGRLPGALSGALRDAVTSVRDAARALLSGLKPEPSAQSQRPDTGRKIAQSAMLQLFEVADRMAAEPQDAVRDVRWCSRGAPDGAFAAPRLSVAPLDVSGLVRTHLLEGRSAVLTSATLALGGSFVPLARSLGLAAPADPEGAASWLGIDVGSPFDYPSQGILYVAKHVPPPGRDGTAPELLDELAALIGAAGGGTLGLFSSRRAAVVAAEAMRARLDTPVLCQGDDQLLALVEAFSADRSASLFGTLSLWQGVDIPGDTCRLVVIDRIPFPRPDDPIRSARSEAVACSGGNGFMSVAATHAALLLAQGAGRLIRTVGDRGVVAVLDSRLVTARYSEFLLRSMPDFWRTTDREVVRSALLRLAALG
jgi:ATP-dependent DNA helicase DinG